MSRARGRLLALAGIALLDWARSARRWPVPVDGALDEPAHLLTAALLLGAWPRPPRPALQKWMLAGSVLIDVDHVPLYLGAMPTTRPGGRPVTHCLLTAGSLLAAARVAPGSARTALAGLGVGACLHFVRDVATGGVGAPLLWPAHSVDVRVPYGAYAALLTAAAAAQPRRKPNSPAQRPR